MKNCKNNEILRKTYYRKSYIRKDGTKVKGSYVHSSCIIDRGNPGKGPLLIKNLKKGTLRHFNYSSSKSEKQRREALKNAINKLGYSTIIKKLNAVKILNKNTNPRVSNTFNKDMIWIQNKFSGKK